MTLREAIRFFARPDARHPSFPVLDAQGRVIGIVDPPVLIAWRHARKRRTDSLEALLAALLAGPVDAEDPRPLAEVRVAGAAVEAHTAGDVALGRDVVADLGVPDGGPDLDDLYVTTANPSGDPAVPDGTARGEGSRRGGRRCGSC